MDYSELATVQVQVL